MKVSSLDTEAALLRDHWKPLLAPQVTGWEALGWPEWRKARTTLGFEDEWWEGLRREQNRMRPGTNRHQTQEGVRPERGWGWGVELHPCEQS